MQRRKCPAVGISRKGPLRKGSCLRPFVPRECGPRTPSPSLIVATRLLPALERRIELLRYRDSGSTNPWRIRSHCAATPFRASSSLWFRCFFAKVEIRIRTGFSQQLTTKVRTWRPLCRPKILRCHQLFKAYRTGVISQEIFARQMDELVAAGDEHSTVPNVFALRGDGLKMAQQIAR